MASSAFQEAASLCLQLLQTLLKGWNIPGVRTGCSLSQWGFYHWAQTREGSLKKDDKKKHLGRAAALSHTMALLPLTGIVPAAHFHKSCFSGSPESNLRGKGSQINENDFYFSVWFQVLCIFFPLSRGTIKEREEQRKKHQEYSGT